MLRGITWSFGQKPTQAQVNLYIQKQCHPAIIFLGTASMNGKMSTGIIYNLTFGVVTSGDISVSTWTLDDTVSSEEAAQAKIGREAMVSFETSQIIAPITPPQLRQHTVFKLSNGDSELGRLFIDLFATAKKLKYDVNTLLLTYSNEEGDMKFTIKDGDATLLGHINLHDESALSTFFDRHGEKIEGVEVVRDVNGAMISVHCYSCGEIFQDNMGVHSIEIIIKVSQQQEEADVRRGINSLAVPRDEQLFRPLNTGLINQRMTSMHSKHQFVQAVSGGTFNANEVDQPWENIQETTLSRQSEDSQTDAWQRKMDVFILLLETFYKHGDRQELNSTTIACFLRGVGPGRKIALAAYNIAFPKPLFVWWNNERHESMQVYASNPWGYEPRVEQHIEHGTWPGDLEIQVDNEEQPTSVSRPKMVTILRIDTVDPLRPQLEEIIAVFGSVFIAQAVMAATGKQARIFSTSIETNNARLAAGEGANWTSCEFKGNFKMGTNSFHKNGLVYYARSCIDSDPQEGIYCAAEILPLPWKFVKSEHFKQNNRKISSAAMLLQTHNEHYDAYRNENIITPVPTGTDRYIGEGWT